MPDKSNIDPGFGVLVPNKPYDVPEQRTPVVAPPGPLYGEGPSVLQTEQEALDKFRRQAGSHFEFQSLIQPIRYDDPMYDKLQRTFDNADRDYLFQKLGFMPNRDNEDLFANNLTRWQKLGLAWDQMGELAKTTFAEQWETEAEFWGNLATARVKDAFLPFGDQEELQSMYDTMQSISSNNYIPLTSEERAGDYGFGKFATALGQFGFTLGTIGAFATQLGLEYGFAALTAVETGGASVVAAGASTANKASRLLRIAEMFKNLNRFENTAQTTNKIRQAYDYLTNTQNLKTGFGKFYSFSKQWNAAAGEAKFEAAFSYGDHINSEIEKAKQQGITLSFADRERIEKDGMEIAMRNGITNTGLLFVMNRMNMNNLFRGPFNPQRRYMTELASSIQDDLVKVAGKTMSRFEVPFFTKQGMLQAGKSLGTWTANSAWEGVQEVSQGISSNYWEAFYDNKYSEEKVNNLYLLGKTIGDRLESNEAFEEFISGFIIGAPGSMVNAGLGRLMTSGAQRAQYKQVVSDYAKKINEYENDPLRVFDQRKANANTQMSISSQMDEAVRTNNVYAYKNLSKEQMRDMIMLGIRTGKLDYMIGNMKDQVANMSDEDFQKQFAMVSDATNRKKATDYINAFEQESINILKEYDKTKQLFPNPYSNTKNVAKGSPEEIDQKIKYQAWEDAVQDLVFERNNYNDTLKRMREILGDSKEYIGDALYNTYQMLTSDRSVDKEISMLQLEIANDLKIENKDKSVLDRINKKKKQIEALKKWRQSYTAIVDFRDNPQPIDLLQDSTADQEWKNKSRDVFEEVLNAYQLDEDLTPLTSENIGRAYQGVLDFIQLQKDNETAVKNISFLSSPEGFDQNFGQRALQAELFYNKVLQNRKETIQKREAVLQALEEDAEFYNRPDVQELVQILNQTIAESEHDASAVILDMLQEIYEKGEIAEPVNVEDTSKDSADKPLIGETPEGDYLIAFEGVNYQVFKDEPELFYVEMPDGTIDPIENINVPQAVKDALKDYIAKKTQPQQPSTAVVGGPPPKSSQPSNLTFTDFLSKIANADQATLSGLAEDISKNVTTAPYSNFNNAELGMIYDAMEKRQAELDLQAQKAKPKVGTKSENDTDFIQEYNEALTKVKQIVDKEGVTPNEVKAAFASMMTVLNTLADAAVRNKYIANLITQQNAIIDRINKINYAKNPVLIKSTIDDIFKNNTSLETAVQEILVLFENSTDPSIKEEMISYFEEAFKKKVDEMTESLKALASQGVTSEVLKKFAEETTKFRNNVIASLNELETLSGQIADETANNNYNLAVSVDESFTNPTHRYIIDNISPTIKATLSQTIAIRNLVNAGILTEDEVATTDQDILVEASDLINLGVARIFTIGINKELHRYFTLGKKDRKKDLEDIIATYLETKDDDFKGPIALETAREFIKTAEDNGQSVDVLLEALEIPTTSIISDEHRDLLDKQRRVLNDLLRNNATLDIMTSLDERQNTALSSLGMETVEPSYFIDAEFINKLSKLSKKDADKVAMKSELTALVNEVKDETDIKVANKKINTFVQKYASNNARAASNLKNVVISTVSYISQTQNAIDSGETSKEPLTDNDIKGVLSGNTVPLTLAQINQVQEFALNVVLEDAKKTFNVTSGYVGSIDFTPEMLPDPTAGFRTKFSVLRIKEAGDIRTLEDLNALLKVENNTVNTHTALRMIMDSDFSTPSEKMIAGRLLTIIPSTETITIDNAQEDLGTYDVDTNMVTINLASVGYKEDAPTYPVETLILHELLHRVIEVEASNPKSSFYNQIRSVIEVVKNNPASKTFYAFQGNLTEDEQVREFVIEALTNPAFQYHLSQIQYAKSGKTAWEKFVDVLVKMLAAVGINVDGTALGEVLNVTDDLLRFQASEETLKRISVANKEQLGELQKEVESDTTMIPSVKDAMMSLINKKLQGYASAEMYNKTKTMNPFKGSDGITYYYAIDNGSLLVVRKSRDGYKESKKQSIKVEIINQLIKTNKIGSFIPKNIVEEILNVAGDPKVMGTYSSGAMVSDGATIGETRFPNASEAVVEIPIRNPQDYTKFKNDFWAAMKLRGAARAGALDTMRSKYGSTAVGDYGELANAIGSRADIERLVRMGYISIGKTGANTLGDLTYDTNLTQDELFEMYKFVLGGGKLNMSEYSDISNYINRALSSLFKVPISAELQTKIESELFNIEQEEYDEVPPPPAEDGVVIFSTTSKGMEEDPAAYAANKDDIELTNTAVETNPLRSFYPDGYTDYNTGEFVENKQFKLYYNKVRAVVNALSVKNLEELKGVMVTFDIDNEFLRWDGSAQDSEWKEAQKGVVGYLSDNKGNPYIFNKKGDIVGTLDRNNLADQKGLNDGENQIVYFYTFANPERPAAKAAQKNDPEGFAKLMEMRKMVMSGTPVISALTSVSQGQFNKKVLVNPTNANRQDTRNDEFRDQLLQPHVTFAFSNKSGTLLANVKAPNGSVNSFGLFAPNMRYVSIKVGDKQMPITDYVMELMRVYQEVLLRDPKAAEQIQSGLVMFNNNMWLTGLDKNVQIPKSLRRVGVKEYTTTAQGKRLPSLNYYDLFSVVNGVVVMNDKNAQLLRNYLNNQPMNIWSQWLSRKQEFMIPVIVTRGDERSITFVKKDYKEFLFKDVGLKSNVVEIPAEENLTAYNSIVHFTEGQPLNPVTQVIAPTTQDLIDDPNAIKKSIENVGDDVKTDEEEIKALKKGRRFKVPGYTEIFEKICR